MQARPASRSRLLLPLVASVCCALSACGQPGSPAPATPRVAPPAPEAENPCDPVRAMGYLKSLCDLGPRRSGSPGMVKQRELVQRHFEGLGATVTRQTFSAVDPATGRRVRMVNLVCRFHPEAQERLLLCAHYDTRPFPDRDPNPRVARGGRFLGANDGASGVAVLMELGRHVPRLKGPLGVDIVLFDGEELVYFDGRRDVGVYFLGSTHFAREHRRKPTATYKWGVLLDMVGDKDLGIFQEAQSASWPETRPLVDAIWATAARVGARSFVPRTKHLVQDDHVPLRNIGGIPTCDLIDFDYDGAWHTEADAPRRCSGASLAEVGHVVWEWMRWEQAVAAAATPGP